MPDKMTIIATIAGICTTISFLPQVIKIHRTKETRDLSMPTYLIFSFGVFMWMCYGFMVQSLPIILANGITFILSIYILAAKLKNG